MAVDHLAIRPSAPTIAELPLEEKSDPGPSLLSIPEHCPLSDTDEDQPDDSAYEEEFESNPETDPLSQQAPQSLAEREVAVKLIVPRSPPVENPDEWRTKVQNLLACMSDPNLRTDHSSLPEAEALLASLPSLLCNPDQFVAGSFTSCHAAWEALLGKSNCKSAKSVLSWLKHGVKPQFVGTHEAKESKEIW
jgi:hypothetical protein